MQNIQQLIKQEKKLQEAKAKLEQEYDQKELELARQHEEAMTKMSEKLQNREKVISEALEDEKKKLVLQVEKDYSAPLEKSKKVKSEKRSEAKNLIITTSFSVLN